MVAVRVTPLTVSSRLVSVPDDKASWSPIDTAATDVFYCLPGTHQTQTVAVD